MTKSPLTSVKMSMKARTSLGSVGRPGFGSRTRRTEAIVGSPQFGLPNRANDMRKLRAYDPARGAKLGSWLGLLAINTAYDYLRQTSRRPLLDRIDGSPERAGDGPSALDDLLEKERWGYLNRIFAANEIGPFVAALARRIATFPVEAVRLAKESINNAEKPLSESLPDEAFLFQRTLRTEGAQRNMRRFLEMGGQTREGELKVGELMGKVAKP